MKLSSASLLALSASSVINGGQAFLQNGGSVAPNLGGTGNKVNLHNAAFTQSGAAGQLANAVNDPRMVGVNGVTTLEGVRTSALLAHGENAENHHGVDESHQTQGRESAGGEPDKIAAESRALIEASKTLSFAVPGDKGDHTELSYAPFSFEDKPMTFYVLGSPIAGASRALIASAQSGKPTAVLFMAPESETRQMFARKRLALQVHAEPVARDSKEWGEQIEKLRGRYGKIVETLSMMPDFSMLALKPFKGRLIKGFGQIYDLAGENLMHSEPVRRGHEGKEA